MWKKFARLYSERLVSKSYWNYWIPKVDDLKISNFNAHPVKIDRKVRATHATLRTDPFFLFSFPPERFQNVFFSSDDGLRSSPFFFASPRLCTYLWCDVRRRVSVKIASGSPRSSSVGPLRTSTETFAWPRGVRSLARGHANRMKAINSFVRFTWLKRLVRAQHLR